MTTQAHQHLKTEKTNCELARPSSLPRHANRHIHRRTTESIRHMRTMHSQTTMPRLRTAIQSRRPTRHLRRTLNQHQTHHAQRPTTTNKRRTETIHTRHSVRLPIPPLPMPRLPQSTRRHQAQTTPKRATAHPRPTTSRMRRNQPGAMNTPQNSTPKPSICKRATAHSRRTRRIAAETRRGAPPPKWGAHTSRTTETNKKRHSYRFPTIYQRHV